MGFIPLVLNIVAINIVMGEIVLRLRNFCIDSAAILLLTATVLVSAAQTAKLEPAQQDLAPILPGKMWSRLWADREHLYRMVFSSSACLERSERQDRKCYGRSNACTWVMGSL